MATYKRFRPLKKVFIPFLALLIGGGFSLFFMPTKMDKIWKEWRTYTMAWEKNNYELEATYVRDGKEASAEKGLWTEAFSHFYMSSIVSDDTVFSFDLYVKAEQLFIYVGDAWHTASTSDRFIHEFVPLNDPFSWMRELLEEADTVFKRIDSDKGEKIYEATFLTFDELDFRGYSLLEQIETTLTMTVQNEDIKQMVFHVVPKRPNYVGRFDGYPEEMIYELTFEKTDQTPKPLPIEAYEGEPLEGG